MAMIEMINIYKEYPQTIANDNVNMYLNESEILCIVGENGAGKSTLMNILYGLTKPTSGEIRIKGEVKEFSNSIDSMRSGIGMVHQHFMLMNHLTVLENIILGYEPKNGFKIDFKKARKVVNEIQSELGFNLNLDEKVFNLSVGHKQQIEIIKSLYREAETLILDEPTAVLTPQETKELFSNLKRLVKSGRSIILITHKLHEVMQIADRVIVMRHGKVISDKTIDETSINGMTLDMIGKELPSMLKKEEQKDQREVVSISKLNKFNDEGIQVIKDISFSINSGEILGIAGISGNGQNQLQQLLAGISKPNNGEILLNGINIVNDSRKQRIEEGVSYIPEDRSVDGLCLSWSMKDNLIGGFEDTEAFSKGFFKVLKQESINKNADRAIDVFDIRPQQKDILVSSLSGGNQQKVVIARETLNKPSWIIACEPTRGVDIGAISFIKDELLKLRNEGAAIIYFSSDLDEVISISDTLGVIYQGELVSIKPIEEYTRESIGLLMATGGTGNETA